MENILPLLNQQSPRRRFLKEMAFSLGSATLALPALASMKGPHTYLNTEEGLASLEALQSGRKLGIALVGLGKYSEGELAPTLQETKLCRLAAIVTGTPEKADKWKKKYNIADKNVYTYQTFDQIADNSDIDIVYVVLPNALHAKYTIRAAKAGKHVICEKPMAVSSKECQQMIDVCKQAGKKLSIGYRLHFSRITWK